MGTGTDTEIERTKKPDRVKRKKKNEKKEQSGLENPKQTRKNLKKNSDMHRQRDSTS